MILLIMKLRIIIIIMSITLLGGPGGPQLRRIDDYT